MRDQEIKMGSIIFSCNKQNIRSLWCVVTFDIDRHVTDEKNYFLCFGHGKTVSNKFTKKFGTEREENQEKRLARAVGRQEQQWQGFKSFRGEFKKARTGTNLAAVERYKTRVRVKSLPVYNNKQFLICCASVRFWNTNVVKISEELH